MASHRYACRYGKPLQVFECAPARRTRCPNCDATLGAGPCYRLDRPEPKPMKKQLVTIYTRGSMIGGIQRHVGELIRHGRRPYAQYPAAPYVEFMPKRKRTPVLFQESERDPFLLIVHGETAPEPPSFFLPPTPGGTPGVTVRRGRYGSCDPRWVTDFNAVINPWLAAHPGWLVADYRDNTAASAAVPTVNAAAVPVNNPAPDPKIIPFPVNAPSRMEKARAFFEGL